MNQKKRSGPAVSRARAYVETIAADMRRQHRERLPTVTKLSRLAGVSRVSMLSALHELRDRGLVRIESGRGVFVVTAGDPALDAAQTDALGHAWSAHKWARATEALRRDILAGKYQPESRLPPTKQLTALYGVSYRTLRKAIGPLVSVGLLRHEGLRYVVRRHGQSASRNLVLVLARETSGTQVGGDETLERVRTVEQVCSAMRLDVSFAFYNFEGEDMKVANRPNGVALSAEENERLMGTIVVTPGIRVALLRQDLALLRGLGRPISVLDEDGNMAERLGSVGDTRTRYFRLGTGTRSGYEMGLYLLQTGHRRVAYLSPLHENNWSRRRLDGLRQALSDAGAPPPSEHTGEVYPLYEHRDLFRAAPVLVEAIQGSVPQPWEFHDIAVDAVEELVRDNRLDSMFRNAFKRLLQKEVLLPLMEEALTSEATAWVAANDRVAEMCLNFLTSRGISVPGEVSLLGFDDSVTAFVRKITSYGFDRRGLYHTMVEHLVRPTAMGPRRRVFDAEGAVRARDTSRRIESP